MSIWHVLVCLSHCVHEPSLPIRRVLPVCVTLSSRTCLVFVWRFVSLYPHCVLLTTLFVSPCLHALLTVCLTVSSSLAVCLTSVSLLYPQLLLGLGLTCFFVSTRRSMSLSLSSIHSSFHDTVTISFHSSFYVTVAVSIHSSFHVTVSIRLR